MIPQRHMYARVTITVSPRERMLAARRKRYGRRMELAGIRPESIKKYLARGFKGPFMRALESELRLLRWDIAYFGRKRRRDLSHRLAA